MDRTLRVGIVGGHRGESFVLGFQGQAGYYNALRYAESDDGIHWKLPTVGNSKMSAGGYRNIVFGADLTPTQGYHVGSVFVDPSASKNERYKVFHLGLINRKKINS